MSYLNQISTWIVGVAGSVYAFVTGHFDVATQILIGLMLMDIVTGLMKGLQKKRLKSAIMHMGIMKKGAIALSIVFAYMLDLLLNDGQPVFVTMMTWLSIGNEGLSVIENLTALGVGIPKQITDRLAQFADHSEQVHEEKDSK